MAWPDEADFDLMDEVSDVDRRFFEVFPEASEFLRPLFPGEFGVEFEVDVFAVRVVQVEPGIRMRMPLKQYRRAA